LRIPLTVRSLNQALRGNQHSAGSVDLVHPARVESGSSDDAEAVRARQQRSARGCPLVEVDRDPPHAAVVHAPELRLQTFAECHHGAVRVGGQELLYLLVKAPGPQRLGLSEQRMGGAEPLLKPRSEAVGELDADRVGEHGVATASLGGTVVEIPQHRLRHVAVFMAMTPVAVAHLLSSSIAWAVPVRDAT
jgi:hypothetical protein